MIEKIAVAIILIVLEIVVACIVYKWTNKDKNDTIVICAMINIILISIYSLYMSAHFVADLIKMIKN